MSPSARRVGEYRCFVVEAPADGTHVFTVESVDGSGNVSAKSNPLTLTNPDC